MIRQMSLKDDIDDKKIYSIWGVGPDDIDKYRTPLNALNRNALTKINVSQKYIPKKDDSIKIYSTLNSSIIPITHATLIIDSNDDEGNIRTYSLGFTSSDESKLCILSPDPTIIEGFRNKRSHNPDLIYEQDGIDDSSIEKLNYYINRADLEGNFPYRRQIVQKCFKEREYKSFFSRQRTGFNCWTALEDIFPKFKVNKITGNPLLYLARGILKKRKYTKKKSRKNKKKYKKKDKKYTKKK